MRRLQRLLLLLLAAPSLCLAAITPFPGVNPQVVKAGRPFGTELRFRVTDAAGAPVSGAAVSYYDGIARTMSAEPGARACNTEFNSFYCNVVSGQDGVAVFPTLAGRWAGKADIQVSATKDGAPLGSIALDIEVQPAQPPAVLELVRPTDQRVEIGKQLSPITVRLTTAAGQPFAGQALHPIPSIWNTGQRGGFELPLSELTVTTGPDGTAQLTLRAPWGLGRQKATIIYVDYAAFAYATVEIEYTTTAPGGGDTLSLQGLFWGGQNENGWGVSVVQSGDQLFNVFFVYDAQGRPTWFVQPGGRWNGSGFGDYLTGTLYSTRATPWYAYDANRLAVFSEGMGFTRFSGRDNGRIDIGYNPTTYNYTWKNLVRQDLRRSTALPARGVDGMWWGGPSQNGWGIAIHEQEGNLFLVWFTYDADGLPTWFVMPDGSWSGDVFSGTIYRTRSSNWFGPVYNASSLSSQAVGQFSIFFAGTQRAALQYSLEGRSGTLNLERQPF